MKRNFGVDIARIMSMFMVVVIHNLNQGGVLRNTTSVTGYLSSYELFNLSIVAVNVFALITGYVYSGKGIKLKRVVGLYLEVLFLSVFSLVIYTLFFGLPKNVDIIKSMFPLLTGVYWYYNAYVGFVLIEPILRIGVNSLTRNNLLRILVVMLLFAGFVGFIDNSFLQRGYSIEWLVILFIAGNVIKKYSGEISHISNKLLVALIVSASLVSLIAEFVFKSQALRFGWYTSPLVIIQSIAVFILFSRIKIKNNFIQKALLFVSPLSFGVYILDTSIVFYNYILKDLFKWLTRENSIVTTLITVVGSSVAMFFIFILINFMRVKIFDWLKINYVIDRFTGFLERKLSKISI